MCNKPNKCHAKKSGGRGLCESWAGAGTPHKGVGRCSRHGGNSANGIKGAARLSIASMATEADADPYEVLLKTIRLAWGAVTFLRNKLDQYEVHQEELTENVEAGIKSYTRQTDYGMWLQIYGEWVDRAAKHAKLALDAGIAEREVRVAEEQGALMASAIKAILDGLGLTKAQQAKAPQLVRQTLLALTAG